MKSKLTGGFGSRIILASKNKAIRKLIQAIYPPAPFVNVIKTDHKEFIKLQVFGDRKTVLEIGSGLSKGPGSWLWNGKNKNYDDKYITRLDIVSGENIDIVADATNLPATLGSFDSIVLQSVPEHIENTQLLTKNIDKHLKKGGIVYIECPFLQGVHGDPDDYYRFTLQGLRKIFPYYEVMLQGVSGGPVGGLVWLICDLLSNITPYSKLNTAIRFFTRWILSPLRYLDYLLRCTKSAERLASEYFILLKKIK
jgi:SAM-dependent methyltransferase